MTRSSRRRRPPTGSAPAEIATEAVTRRTAGVLLAVALVPLVGGCVLAQAPAGSGPPLPCPFRLATGWPCPFCGATRAFTALGRGDIGGILHHNAVWVIVALVAAAVAVVGLIAPRSGRLLADLRAPGRRWPVPVLLVLALAWAWAVLQRATIVG